MIEGINIEYGKIENCKIDTILASKISRRLTSNTNDVNIEFSIENVNIETVTSKLASTYLTSTRSIRSIGSISDRSDRYRIDRIDPMAFWPNFKLFRPKLSPNRTKNGHFKLFTKQKWPFLWLAMAIIICYFQKYTKYSIIFVQWFRTSSIFE